MREIWALKRLKNLSTELTCEIVYPKMEFFFYKFIYFLKRCFYFFLLLELFYLFFYFSFEGFVYFYFLHHRFQIKLRARLYQFLVKQLNKLSSKGAKSHFQNQSRTNCNSAKKICSARLRVGFPRELISKHRFKNKYRLGVGVL